MKSCIFKFINLYIYAEDKPKPGPTKISCMGLSPIIGYISLFCRSGSCFNPVITTFKSRSEGGHGGSALIAFDKLSAIAENPS